MVVSNISVVEDVPNMFQNSTRQFRSGHLIPLSVLRNERDLKSIPTDLTRLLSTHNRLSHPQGKRHVSTLDALSRCLGATVKQLPGADVEPLSEQRFPRFESARLYSHSA